jgi:L-seryl-tRNA(Ser) seleniumtransferase
VTLRELPSVESLLQEETALSLIDQFGRPLAIQAVRATLEEARTRIRRGDKTPTPDQLLSEVEQVLDVWTAPNLHRAINATGVIIHTNLGRSPLSAEAIAAIENISLGYSNLEYDFQRGKRGKREQHLERTLQRITGASAGLVVNNNAAAILLALTGLAKRKEVLISRSQLIEIGGGFRIPEVLKQSGAKLVEVGTTNRTHLDDFKASIGPKTGLIFHAHHSNFKIVGFTTEPTLEQLVQVGKSNDVPVLEDLGSGSLLDTEQFGLGHEPTVQESLHVGANLVAFSGDKLLGGPQAGILVGDRDLIQRLKKHPLARAVRADKLCLAALDATLNAYMKDEAIQKLPVWMMISTTEEQLKARAENWSKALGAGEVVQGKSTVGGGSLPEETLPTWLLAIDRKHPQKLAAKLREHKIIARIQNDQVVLDPRTVLPSEDEVLLASLKSILKEGA